MRCSVVYSVTLRLLVVNISSSSLAIKGPFIATQLNSTRRRVELRRYKRVFTPRLLPAMCHNLRDGGHGPLATVFTTPGLLQR